MPWQERNKVTERAKFVMEWLRRRRECGRRANFAELCRMSGISRETGYDWLNRFLAADHDLGALEDRSSRPVTSPTSTPPEMIETILAARRDHPRWGSRTLIAWLRDRHPMRSFPHPSTARRILEQHGMLAKRRLRRRRAPALGIPFAEATAPNAVWCIDFKGAITTGDGVRCAPFTVLDAFSRFCVRCELLEEATSQNVMRVLDSAFREYGLPAAIRSDNGPPFASTGAGGLTELAVWLLRLGIRLERIAKGEPQQNGRLERYHRTIEAESASPPKATWRAQRRAFYFHRAEYNDERPHQALAMKTPADVYVPSSRRYPRPLLPVDAGLPAVVYTVDGKGCITFGRKRVLISQALRHERVIVDPAHKRWEVRFGDVLLGTIDERTPTIFRMAPRPSGPYILEFQCQGGPGPDVSGRS